MAVGDDGDVHDHDDQEEDEEEEDHDGDKAGRRNGVGEANQIARARHTCRTNDWSLAVRSEGNNGGEGGNR